jgi:hypothetical protein
LPAEFSTTALAAGHQAIALFCQIDAKCPDIPKNELLTNRRCPFMSKGAAHVLFQSGACRRDQFPMKEDIFIFEGAERASPVR